MAKKIKKNIKQFQQALLSNASFIKQSDDNEPQPMVQEEGIIEDDVMEKMELLAAYENTSTKELVNKALNHFLRLKSLQLEEAMKNKKQ